MTNLDSLLKSREELRDKTGFLLEAGVSGNKNDKKKKNCQFSSLATTLYDNTWKHLCW